MSRYSSWQTKELLVTNLMLDPRNPRIPSGDTELSQRQLIAELVEHDKVYELAKEITENGFYPVESLIGVEESGTILILEGNRRLAALKLLISPEMAPDAVGRKFRNLSAKIDLNDIRKVRVLVAPTREAAAPLIMQKHTRDQVARWSPLMQARFFRTLSKGGLPVEDMAKQYGISAGEIAKFLRTDSMYQLACEMDLPEDVRSNVHDPREFPNAVLERLLDFAKVREQLGIGFNEQGELQGTVDPAEFRKAFTRIVTDIGRKKIDTRTLNTADLAMAYVKGLGSDAPDLTKSGSFTADDLKPRAPTQSEPTPTPVRKPRAKPVKHASSTLIASGTKCRVANPKIKEVFEELKHLKVDSFPNACASLLRILLELAMGHYLDKTKKIDALLTKKDSKDKRGDWYPSWKQMLQAILGDRDIKIPPQAKRRLSKLASEPNYSFLDGVVHNRFVIADTRELRNLAAAMEDLLTILLQEPASEPEVPSGKKG